MKISLLLCLSFQSLLVTSYPVKVLWDYVPLQSIGNAVASTAVGETTKAALDAIKNRWNRPPKAAPNDLEAAMGSVAGTPTQAIAATAAQHHITPESVNQHQTAFPNQMLALNPGRISIPCPTCQGHGALGVDGKGVPKLPTIAPPPPLPRADPRNAENRGGDRIPSRQNSRDNIPLTNQGQTGNQRAESSAKGADRAAGQQGGNQAALPTPPVKANNKTPLPEIPRSSSASNQVKSKSPPSNPTRSNSGDTIKPVKEAPTRSNSGDSIKPVKEAPTRSNSGDSIKTVKRLPKPPQRTPSNSSKQSSSNPPQPPQQKQSLGSKLKQKLHIGSSSKNPAPPASKTDRSKTPAKNSLASKLKQKLHIGSKSSSTKTNKAAPATPTPATPKPAKQKTPSLVSKAVSALTGKKKKT